MHPKSTVPVTEKLVPRHGMEGSPRHGVEGSRHGMERTPIIRLSYGEFLCFGVKSGARRGHRVWTSYYCAKLVVFPSPGTQIGYFPPQIPKIVLFGDFHENIIKWVIFCEKVVAGWKYY